MDKVTVSVKVSSKTAQRISQTGFLISDIMHAGIELFLDQSPQRQESLIWSQMLRKKTARAMKRSQFILDNPC